MRWRACEHWNLIDVRRKGVYGGSSNVFSTSRSPTGKKILSYFLVFGSFFHSHEDTFRPEERKEELLAFPPTNEAMTPICICD